MTVRELITELEKIPNQNLEVKMMYDEYYDDDGYMEVYPEEKEIEGVFVHEDILHKPKAYIYED